MAKAMVDNTATLGFEAKLWHAADLMRGKLPATQYRQVLMGLLFLRYVSDAFENRYRELKAEGYGDEEDRDAYMEKNIFFVPKSARWAKIAAVAHEANNGETIDNAMIAIERENKTLKGVLPKFYGSSDINKRMLGDVIDLFTNELPLGDIEANRDILGRTYEYCIQHFAEYEGKGGGEYYTPETIVRTLVEVLQPAAGMRIYDPCCGSGGMFSQSMKFIREHSGNRGDVSVFGQESNPDTWKIAKINMAIRGIGANFGMGHEDTLMHDIHAGTQMDRILANPPFNQKKWGADKVKDDPRWKYGLPPDGNANYAWIQHMISHLKPHGRIGIVLANAALTSNKGGEDKIRKEIIEADLIEGIVALPPQMFYSVTVPVTLWFLSRAKEQPKKTLFIDASNLGRMVDSTHRVFSDEDIALIGELFKRFRAGTLKSEPGFYAVVGTERIAEEGYVLTPGPYVGVEKVVARRSGLKEALPLLLSQYQVVTQTGHNLAEKVSRLNDDLPALMEVLSPILTGKAKLPNGWRRDRADEFFDITIGKTPPRKEQYHFTNEREGNVVWASIADMGSSGVFIGNSSEYLLPGSVESCNMVKVPADTVILSFKLTVGRVAITTCELTTNEAIAHFKTKNPNLREYTYLYLKAFKYSTLGSTSSIATAVNSKMIKAMPFVMPDEAFLEKFHKAAKPLFDKIRNLQQESLMLKQIRDSIMPQIVKG